MYKRQLPKIIENENCDFFFYLKKSEDLKTYEKILKGKSHEKRKIYHHDLDSNDEIEKEMIELCKQKNIPIIPFIDIQKRVDLVTKLINEEYN